MNEHRRRVGSSLAPWGLAGGWVLLALLGLWLDSLWLPSARFEGAILPTSHDGFYHARRILDAAADPTRFYEFDPFIHAPEGSWVTWPWAYDLGLAWLARGLVTLGLATDPAWILIAFPPALGIVNLLLVMAITRGLRMPPAAALGTGLAWVALPLTQLLHAVGRIDHHGIEHTFALLLLAVGLPLFRTPTAGRAFLGGALVGVGPAFYNGLFILFLPLVLAQGILWLRGRALPARASVALGTGLTFGTGLACLGSTPFHEGMWSYTLLSWFHLYVAALSGLVIALPGLVPLSRKAAIALGAGALAGLWPLAGELGAGLTFVEGAIPGLAAMSEVRSPYGLGSAPALGIGPASALYTGLVWLLPFALGRAAGLLVAGPETRERTLLYTSALVGGLLMAAQLRFHQYGSPFLFLLWFLWLGDLLGQGPATGLRPAGGVAARLLERAGSLRVGAAAALLTVLLYLPALPSLFRIPVPGWSGEYFLTRPLYPALAEHCRVRPGIVIAPPIDGHYIRYHTGCAVVANQFMLTRQHVEKIAFVESLLAGPAEAIRERAPWARYLLVRRRDNVLDASLDEASLRAQNRGVADALLLSGAPPPPGLRALAEVRLGRYRGARDVVARLYEIEPEGAPGGRANEPPEVGGARGAGLPGPPVRPRKRQRSPETVDRGAIHERAP